MGGAALLTIALAALAGSAHAACEPACDGLVVELRGRALAVAAVLPGSSAAEEGIAVGDVLRQVNGVRASSCEEWGRVVRDAAAEGLALLVLTERGRVRRVAALSPAQPPPVAAARPPEVSPPSPAPATGTPSRARSRGPLVPPEAPLPAASVDPAAARATLLEVLGRLGPDRPGQLDAYRPLVEEARQALAGLLVAAPAAADSDAASAIVHRHEGALLAWEAMDALREREGWRASMPIGDAATAPFFADSPVTRLIEEVPELATVVTRWPHARGVERSGLWQPVRARRLLWADADARWSAVVGTPPAD